MRDDLDFSQPLTCDVAIAGAGLAGLVAGAILTRHGQRVLVVDRNPEVGGRGGSTPHRGYRLDGGWRDGWDVTDLQVGWRHGQLAAREARVDVPLRIVKPVVRVHHLPEPPSADEGTVVVGHWGARGFLDLARDGFGCPETRIGDFAKVLARIAGASAEERRAAVPIPLSEWLEATVPEPEVRRAILTMVSVIYCEFPERASTGRLMGFLADRPDLPKLQTAFPDHEEIGGMQGLIQPWADAIEAGGGRILLGLEPAQVTFEGTRVTGLVARDESHLVLEVRAPAVVLAAPLWEALPLIPSERIDPELAQLARALEEEQADAICWQAGLTRIPRLRSTGESEGHVGWNRVLIGPGRRYAGGFQLPSLASRRSAPAGRHLLHAFIGRWLKREQSPPWAESREAITHMIDYLKHFYLDLEECIEWSAIQWIQRPACLAWYWATIVRHGIRAPGCDGLYLGSTTLESDAGPVDIAAHAGLEAAHAILADTGPSDAG